MRVSTISSLLYQVHLNRNCSAEPNKEAAGWMCQRAERCRTKTVAVVTAFRCHSDSFSVRVVYSDIHVSED